MIYTAAGRIALSGMLCIVGFDQPCEASGPDVLIDRGARTPGHATGAGAMPDAYSSTW